MRILFGFAFVLLVAIGSCGAYKMVQKQRSLELAITLLKKQVPVSETASINVSDSNGERGARAKRLWSEVQTDVNNTVVQVFVQVAQFNWLEPYATPAQGEASGTGFLIDDQGYLITNAHVISETKGIAIQVPKLGKERLDATLVGVSFDRDIALLRISDEGVAKIKEAMGHVPYLKLGNSDQVLRGDEIMTLGYPLGQQSLKSTVGVVSGRESMEYRQYLQIDAAINPGNSGGPSVNFNGEVVGINTAGVPNAQNVGYIIPINELKIVLNDLHKFEHEQNKMLRKPFLGIGYGAGSLALNTSLGNPLGGIYITEVFKGGLLQKAGVKKGDILYEINGYRIDSYGQLNVPWCEDKISIDNYTFYLRYGEQVKIVLYRKGERKEIVVKFEHSILPVVRAMHPDFESIEYEVIGGMVIMQLTRNHLPLLLSASPLLIRYGEPKNQLKPVLIITHIIPDSVAQRSRVLSPAARLKEINGVKVNTLEELRKAVLKSTDTGYLTVRVSDGFFAVFPIKQMLADEPRLSFIYKYQISSTIQDLAQAVAPHALQKTA